MRRRLRPTLEALVLLAMGLGSLALSTHEAYTRLMNPSFRWVTVVGAVLLTLMGLVLLVRPRRQAGPFALIVFLVFFGVLALGTPLAPGVSPTMPMAGAGMPAIEREGYDELKVESLFETIQVEGHAVEEGRYVVKGFVYRRPELDAENTFILLEPMMACCLADAIALGVRVKTSAPLPDPDAWVYAFGQLRRLETPIATPRFRIGAILFTNVSRMHVVDADEVLPFRALLPNVVDRIPAERCARFRAALAETGLSEILRGEGPFTLFVPLDLTFERLGEEDAARLFSPQGRAELRERLEAFIVPGYHSKNDLFALDTLTTLSGRTLSIEAVNGRLTVEGARILFGDQPAKNGVLHLVHPGWIGR